jgi:hypothetical protein
MLGVPPAIARQKRQSYRDIDVKKEQSHLHMGQLLLTIM